MVEGFVHNAQKVETVNTYPCKKNPPTKRPIFGVSINNFMYVQWGSECPTFK